MATISKNTPPREAANVAVAKKPGDANSSNRAFRLILLVLMVLQNTATVLVGRYSRASVSKEDSYVVNHLIVTCEAVKVRAFGLDWFWAWLSNVLCQCSAHVVPIDVCDVCAWLVALVWLMVNNTYLMRDIFEGPLPCV